MTTEPLHVQAEQFMFEHWHHDDPLMRQCLDEFTRILTTEKVDELTSEHSNGGRFGMSGAGGPTRAKALKFLGHEAEPFSGSTLFTFFEGHLLEAFAVAMLRTMGINVEGTQEPVRIDPFMHSFSDGIIRPYKDYGDVILSVKTQGYKKSGQQRGKWMRYGFAQLWMDSVRKAQPTWYAQVQAEMHGADIPYSLVFVIAKDTIKAMENDPFNPGSLSFYSEVIPYDRDFVQESLLPVWSETWAAVQRGEAPTCYAMNAETGRHVALPQPASQRWEHNREATGTYNPCAYCQFYEPCKEEYAKSNPYAKKFKKAAV